MKVHLNDTKEELEKEKEDLGLSKESAGEENIYGISLPIAICSPFNADFDGDAMTCHLVPDDPEIQEETYARMSPRYVNVYKKNNSPILKSGFIYIKKNYINCWKDIKSLINS